MGATYYVAPNGSDGNNGSISQPFATLNKAWSVVGAGDIIYLRGGTYYFRSQQMLTGRTAPSGNHIKVWAYPGEKPILSRADSYDYDYSCGIYFRGNYVHFKGIEITGYRQINQLFGLVCGLRTQIIIYSKYWISTIMDMVYLFVEFR